MLTYPTIHLNGTSAQDLLRRTRAARRAVDAAMNALSEASPHGRDYYPQGDGAIGKAISEHLARMEHLRAVRGELGEIEMSILDARPDADAGDR